MKAVLIGPEFHNYNASIAKALEGLDVRTTVMPFQEQGFSTARQRYSRIQSGIEDGVSKPLRHGVRRFSRGVLFPNWSIQPEIPKLRAYGTRLVKSLEAEKPDVLIVIKGTSLLPETLRKITKALPSMRRVLWAQDSVTRYPMVLSGIDQYNSVFVFEPSDVEFLGRKGVKARYLPMGYDPDIYRPLKDSPKKKTWTIVFVGEGRPERCSVLEDLGRGLISSGRHLKIGVFGDRWAQFEKRLAGSGGDSVEWTIKTQNVLPEDVNRIYNESEIGLNLHHAQSREGLNPRTFEIPGSGALEVVDRRPVLDSMFEDGKEIVSFESTETLCSKVTSLLDRPKDMSTIAEKGHQRALKDHTLSQRVGELVSRL